ncbi:MAG: lipocalin family protein [Candidatus Paceibacterota bacterium]|jgi:hypothetical protein
MKTKTFLIIVFSLSLWFLTGCEKESPPNEDTQKYKITNVPSQVHGMVGKVISIPFSSNGADRVSVVFPTGDTIFDKDPLQDTTTVIMAEEGMSSVTITFYWDERIPISVEKICYVFGHLPLKMSASSTQIPWRTATSITIESYGCDSIWTNIEGWNWNSSSSDTIETPLLDASKTYDAIGYNNGVEEGRCSVSITVNAPTRADTISSKMGSWGGISAIYFEVPPGNEWVPGEPRLCFSDDTTTYCPDSRMIANFGEIKCGTEPTMAEFNWSLEGNTLILSNNGNIDTREIVSLSSDTLVWQYHPLGAQLMTRETFIRIHN